MTKTKTAVDERVEARDFEEERELGEFELTEDEFAEANALVGEIMERVFESVDGQLVGEFGSRLYATSEKERFIGRKLEVIQKELFFCFTALCQGMLPTSTVPVGLPCGRLEFPYKFL